MKKQMMKEIAKAKKLEERVEELRSTVQHLEKSDDQLQLWKQKEPQIKHYLGLVTKLAK